MAKKKNVFGIRKGEHPETKEIIINEVIEAPWEVAKHYVTGVAGAEYKGFSNREEAEAYIAGVEETVKKPEKKIEKKNQTSMTHKEGVLYCYVDGCFNSDIQNYGYGLVYVKNGRVLGIDKGIGNNEQAVEMYQVGGELLGAMKSLIYSKKHGEKEVVIFHDYLGVGNHATGEWKRKTDFSKVYYEWMQKFFKENPNINVTFEKVDAHAGDDFNELADGYAKLSVGIKPNPVFFRMAKKYGLPTE